MRAGWKALLTRAATGRRGATDTGGAVRGPASRAASA